MQCPPHGADDDEVDFIADFAGFEALVQFSALLLTEIGEFGVVEGPVAGHVMQGLSVPNEDECW